MIDSVCQAYGWSLEAAMRLTLPQIIMINHGAWVNQERSKRKYDRERSNDKKKQSKPLREEDIVVGNKTMDMMNADEIANYVMTWE